MVGITLHLLFMILLSPCTMIALLALDSEQGKDGLLPFIFVCVGFVIPVLSIALILLEH